MVDNSLSPHGGVLVDRVAPQPVSGASLHGLKSVAIRDQIARECVSIAYGFFSPIEGFMLREDVEAVCERMTLASGYVWSVPVLFDVSQADVDRLSLREGDTLLLTHEGQPVATPRRRAVVLGSTSNE